MCDLSGSHYILIMMDASFGWLHHRSPSGTQKSFFEYRAWRSFIPLKLYPSSHISKIINCITGLLDQPSCFRANVWTVVLPSPLDCWGKCQTWSTKVYLFIRKCIYIFSYKHQRNHKFYVNDKFFNVNLFPSSVQVMNN